MRRTTTDYLDDVSTIYPDPDDLSPLARELSDRSISDGKKTNMMRGILTEKIGILLQVLF